MQKFKVEYLSDPEFTKISRLLPCLPFIPICDLEIPLDYIMTEIAAKYPKFMFVFDSFESTYLGKLSADGRSEPRF